jgi:fatty-acyl-CoA synthase
MHHTYADLLTLQRGQTSRLAQRFVTDRTTVERTAADVFDAAQRRGSQLVGLGLSAQERVALLVSDPSEFLPLLHGCLLYGLVPVPFYPPPAFGKLDNYQVALDAVLETANVRVTLVDDGGSRRLGETLAGRRKLELASLPNATLIPLPHVEPSDLALLQFTSGSTQTARGVRVTHAALMANIRAIMLDGLAATPADHGVCWLPLYHDMGLVGFGLAPLLTQTPVTFIPTSRFIRNPNTWLQTLHDVRGTITFAPNFAYALAAKRSNPQNLDLSCVRMWGCGAEPIAEAALRAFETHFAASGVAEGSIAPCYGLAEATLAVTFTPPGTYRQCEAIDREMLSASARASVTPKGVQTAVIPGTSDTSHVIEAQLDSVQCSQPITVVSCGRPLPGFDLSVVDDDGNRLADGLVGEVVVRGPSIGSGYEAQRELSELTFRQSGLFTGDRGYLRDGQLFVIGRSKETLILNGRKYDPHVLEQVLETITNVRRAVAINVTSATSDVLVVVVERTFGATDSDDVLRSTIRAALAARFGVQTSCVVCTSPGTLPRTTSGKLQRVKVRQLFETGTLGQGS